MNRDQAIVTGIASLVVLAVVVAGLAYFSVSVHGTGSIKAVGFKVYGDSGLTKEISAVDWGVVPSGGSSSVTLWIKSTSTNTAETLTYATANWSPATAATYLSVSWDYNGTAIQANGVVAVTFTLKVSQTVTSITSFAFDITLTASG